MISTIIIDDDSMARQSMTFLLDKFDNIELVDSFESAFDAKKYLSENSVDIIFLDIEMPELSGFEFLSTTKELPSIILTTGNPDYAIEAFEYEVLDFLVKPINFARLSKSLDKYERSKRVDKADREDMFVRSEGKFVRVAFDDLLLAQTREDYMCLYMADKSKLIIHSTLSKLEKSLPESRFQKVHRSYIVNLSKIVDVDDTTLVIEDHVVPISRAFRPILKNRLGLA